MDPKKIFTSNLKILEEKLKIIRKALEHNVTKGFLLEKAVADILTTMLPNNLAL